jgi:hypothetical protein
VSTPSSASETSETRSTRNTRNTTRCAAYRASKVLRAPIFMGLERAFMQVSYICVVLTHPALFVLTHPATSLLHRIWRQRSRISGRRCILQ